MYIQFDKVIISRVWDLTWFRSRHEYKINMAHTITTKYCTWYDFLLTKITAHFIANRDLSCCLYIYIYIGFAEELNLSFSKKIMHTQYIFGLKICIIRIKHMHFFLLKTTNLFNQKYYALAVPRKEGKLYLPIPNPRTPENFRRDWRACGKPFHSSFVQCPFPCWHFPETGS